MRKKLRYRRAMSKASKARREARREGRFPAPSVPREAPEGVRATSRDRAVSDLVWKASEALRAEGALDRAVAAARAEGVSWEVIGRCVALSPRGAAYRWGKSDGSGVQSA